MATVAGKEFNSNFISKTYFSDRAFYVTIADADFESLNSLHTLLACTISGTFCIFLESYHCIALTIIELIQLQYNIANLSIKRIPEKKAMCLMCYYVKHKTMNYVYVTLACNYFVIIFFFQKTKLIILGIGNYM